VDELSGRISARWIEQEVKKFIQSPQNTLGADTAEPAWGAPLVGFSSGGDSLYGFYKKDIGDFYLSPMDIMAPELKGIKAGPEDLTVISWVLPHTEATKAEMRMERCFPTQRWVRARTFGEEVNEKLRRHLVQILGQEGILAVAPLHSPLYQRATSTRYGTVRTWSERHAAYAGGLGTFGLSDGLITAVGQAVRVGSVVAHTRIPATGRPYTDHHEYCLYFRKGTCGKCIERCPIGAITKEGHNKELCRRYINIMREYVKRHLGFEGFEGYGCGLCQTGVPCESGIPK